ncbi:MAG: glycosyltransferase family 87 protein [Candidatus Omnitrophota bacterium]
MIKRKKLFCLLALIVIFTIALGVYHDRRTCWGSNDFDTYYFAGKIITTGENVYTHTVFKTALSPYIYLPFFAILISPLTFLDMRVAAVIWYVINIFAFVGAIHLSVRLLGSGEKFSRIFYAKPYLLRIASLVVLSVIWLDNVSLAQIDFMVFFLIVLSFFMYEKKKAFLSGIILAAASVIKIYPAYLLLYLIAKRRFAAVAGFFVGIFLFVFAVPYLVMGPESFKDTMKSWVEIKAAPQLKPCGETVKENYARFDSQFKPSNQSFSAVVTRFFTKDDPDVIYWKEKSYEYRIPWPHPLSPRQVDMLIKILLLAVVAVTYAFLDYRLVYRDKLYLSIEYSVVLLSMVLFFPVVQTHMFAYMTFPIIVLNYIKTKRNEKWIYGEKWIEIAFYAVIVIYALQADEYMKVFGAGAFSIVLLWMLFGAILVKERARRKS